MRKGRRTEGRGVMLGDEGVPIIVSVDLFVVFYFKRGAGESVLYIVGIGLETRRMITGMLCGLFVRISYV
jgi:hypothetical protein